MDGFGEVLGRIIITYIIAAFALGVCSVGVGWLLWHYLFSHLILGWS